MVRRANSAWREVHAPAKPVSHRRLPILRVPQDPSRTRPGRWRGPCYAGGVKVARHVVLSACAALVAAAALASYEEDLAVSKVGDDADAHFRQGSYLESSGQAEAAIAAYEQAISMDQGDPKYRRALVGALMAAGSAAGGPRAGRKSYTSAVQAADSLVRLDPGYESLLLLGQAHVARGTYGRAASAFRRAISTDPGHWRAHCALGEILTHWRRYRAARKALQTALELAVDSDQEMVWGRFGDLYWRQNQYTKAQEAWDKAGEFGTTVAWLRERLPRGTFPRGAFDHGIIEVNNPRMKGPAWLPHGQPAPVPVDG